MTQVTNASDFLNGKGEGENRAEDLDMITVGDPRTNDKAQAKFAGIYRGTRPAPNPRISAIHFMETSDGKRVGLWNSAGITQAFEGLPLGTPARLEFKGTKPLTGGNNLKIIDVEVPPGTKYVDIAKEAPAN